MQNFPFQKTVLSIFSEVFLGGGCRACGLAYKQKVLTEVEKNSQENSEDILCPVWPHAGLDATQGPIADGEHFPLHLMVWEYDL